MALQQKKSFECCNARGFGEEKSIAKIAGILLASSEKCVGLGCCRISEYYNTYAVAEAAGRKN